MLRECGVGFQESCDRVIELSNYDKLLIRSMPDHWETCKIQ